MGAAGRSGRAAQPGPAAPAEDPEPAEPGEPEATRRLADAARRHFGWSRLRPEQLGAMTASLAGRDALVVMPTGSGKSAVYQVPALLLDGPTVVVSPLIALQHDQQAALAERGDDALAAAALNSSAGDGERAEVLRRLADRELTFVFLAPEQLARPDVLAALATARPALVAVDEAHCVSSWGHDLRPDYLRLGAVIDALGHPPVVALTATASPPVRAEILERLGLREPLSLTVAGFDRPEIELVVHPAGGDERSKTDAVIVEAVAATHPTLVYVATKAATVDLAETLAETGLRTAAYHGGMAARRRAEVHERWRSGDLDVVVATSAFGMGIDKADVRSVVHADPPESLDEYLQEIGRAGRDGRPARAVLVWRAEDLALRRFFAGGTPKEADAVHLMAVLALADGSEDVAAVAAAAGFTRQRTLRLLDLLQRTGWVHVGPRGGFVVDAERADPAAAARAAMELADRRRRVEASRVEMVRGYAETTSCRRQVLLASFGEVLPRPCGSCDTCAAGTAAGSADQGPDSASAGTAGSGSDSGSAAPTGPASGTAMDPASDAATDAAPDTALGSGFGSRTTVRHRDWGLGTVVREDGGQLVVLFDEQGFKTLSLEAVRRGGLLTPA